MKQAVHALKDVRLISVMSSKFRTVFEEPRFKKPVNEVPLFLRLSLSCDESFHEPRAQFVHGSF